MSADLFGNEVQPARTFGGQESPGSGSDEWVTPFEVVGALGCFDLDPCSPGARRPWDTAELHYDAEDNGLRKPWRGRVWLNPPYSDAARWVERLALHGTGTALLFARTETRMWHEHVWPKASGLFFIRGRIRFCYVNGKPAGPAAAPSVLIAYGAYDADFLARQQSIDGHYVHLGAPTRAQKKPHTHAGTDAPECTTCTP